MLNMITRLKQLIFEAKGEDFSHASENINSNNFKTEESSEELIIKGEEYFSKTNIVQEEELIIK